jgi:hypothetical protein
MLGELYLVAFVVRDVLYPRYDPVRQGEFPDPPQLTSTRSNVVAV